MKKENIQLVWTGKESEQHIGETGDGCTSRTEKENVGLEKTWLQ